MYQCCIYWVGFKKGKSLKDILVRAKVPQIDQGKGECKGCGGKRCGVCSSLNETKSFFGRDGRKFNIKSGN